MVGTATGSADAEGAWSLELPESSCEVSGTFTMYL